MLLIARTSLSGKGMGRAAEVLERDRALQRVAAELYCSSRSFKLSMGCERRGQCMGMEASSQKHLHPQITLNLKNTSRNRHPLNRHLFHSLPISNPAPYQSLRSTSKMNSNLPGLSLDLPLRLPLLVGTLRNDIDLPSVDLVSQSLDSEALSKSREASAWRCV